MPYRPLYAESQRDLGWCPWCRATTDLDLTSVTTVCGSCGSRFANAFARTPPSDPQEASIVAEHSRIARTFIAIGTVVRILVVAALALGALLVVACVSPLYIFAPLSEKPLPPPWRIRI